MKRTKDRLAKEKKSFFIPSTCSPRGGFSVDPLEGAVRTCVPNFVAERVGEKSFQGKDK